MSRLLLVATACILFVLSTTVPAPAELVSDQPIRAIQFNVCGSVCYNGSLSAATDIVNSINDHDSHVVTLNEICENVFNSVVSQTGMHGYYIETNGPRSGLPAWDNSCSGQRFGNAVLTRNNWTATAQYWYLTPATTTERRALVCHTTQFLHTIRTCVTHVAPSPPATRDQHISQVRDHVNPIAITSWATVMGGDFNSVPTSPYLDRIYSGDFVNGYGLFNEVGQNCGTPGRCGSATHSSGKIDYLFYAGEWCCPGTSVGTALVSDHKVLRGTVLLQP